MTDIDIQLQWHTPDQCFAAVLMRDGEAWYLGGALVGMGTPGDAVTQLIEEAIHLVIVGENFLTEDPISLDDRKWLFMLLDTHVDFDKNEEMYAAIRAANDGKDPYVVELCQGCKERPSVSFVTMGDDQMALCQGCIDNLEDVLEDDDE